MTIGKRLRIVRGDMQRDDFALAIGVHRNSVARYESGERQPDHSYLNRVLQIFQGVSPEWLLTGKGPMVVESDFSSTSLDVAKRDALSVIEEAERLVAKTQKEQRDATIKRLVAFKGMTEDKIKKILGRKTRRHNSQNTIVDESFDLDSIGIGGVQPNARFVVLNQLESDVGDVHRRHVDLAFNEGWLVSALGAQAGSLAVVNISGDAMSPTLNEGDIAVVDVTEKHILNAGLYVVQVDDSYLVKRMQRGLDGSLSVRVDNQAYAPDRLSYDEAAKLHVAGRVIWAGKRL